MSYRQIQLVAGKGPAYPVASEPLLGPINGCSLDGFPEPGVVGAAPRHGHVPVRCGHCFFPVQVTRDLLDCKAPEELRESPESALLEQWAPPEDRDPQGHQVIQCSSRMPPFPNSRSVAQRGRVSSLVDTALFCGYTFDGSDGKESIYKAGDLSLIPGSGKPPEQG